MRLIISPFLFLSLVSFSQTNTWTGTTDTDWHKTCNWSLDAVPTCAHDVVIPTVTNYPIISNVAHCNKIDITSAAANALTVQDSPARLDIGLGGSCTGTPYDAGGCNTTTITATSVTDFAGPNCPVTCLWVRSRTSFDVGCGGETFRFTIFNWEDGITPASVQVEANTPNLVQSFFTDVTVGGYTFTSASASYNPNLSTNTSWSWTAPVTYVDPDSVWYMTCP